MWPILPLISVMLTAGIDITPVPDRPRALVCPKSRGDLDYALYRIMTNSDFVRAGSRDRYAYRQEIRGKQRLLGRDKPSYINAQFRVFPTSKGLELIVELSAKVGRRTEELRNPEGLASFQQVLDAIARVFPCDRAPSTTASP